MFAAKKYSSGDCSVGKGAGQQIIISNGPERRVKEAGTAINGVSTSSQRLDQ